MISLKNTKYNVAWAGTLVPGHQCASGTNPRCPYPGGSLKHQKEAFAAMGVDLANYFHGTLNVDVDPIIFELTSADKMLRGVHWTNMIPPEDFFFSKCLLEIAGCTYESLIYYPHPDTKVEHAQAPTVAEVLAPRIEGLTMGTECTLFVQSAHIDPASASALQLPAGPFSLKLNVLPWGVPPQDPEVILRQRSVAGQALVLEVMPDGGLRFKARFQREGMLPEHQVKGVAHQRAAMEKLPYWRHPGDPTKGELSVCAPGFMIERGRLQELELRWDGLVLRLFLDGVCVDEEWPYGEWLPSVGPIRWPAGGGITLADLRVTPLERGSAMQESDEISDLTLKLRADELLGPEKPFGQYWSPRGNNTSAGDVMLCFAESRLHVLHLNDRRNHGSRWGCGACQFEHFSTPDLNEWTAHPPAFPLERPEENAIGTGGMLYHDGKYLVWGFMLSGRLGSPACDAAPQGVYTAVSDDGIQFRREPEMWLDGCEPGIWYEQSTGIFHLVRPGKRMESRDLKTWTMADENFLPPPASIGNPDNLATSECFNVFEWNGWFYILGGRSGFWMARDIRGPFWPGPIGNIEVAKPRWDVYDGLMVPQGVVVWQGRALLCGWVVDKWWGGSIVFRELIQQSDGTLALQWAPDLTPQHGVMRPLNEDGGITDRIEAAMGSFSWRSFELPEGDFRLLARIKAEAGTQAFGLNVRGEPGYRGGAELRFEPESRRAQWGFAGEGTLAEAAVHPSCWAEDFFIEGVEGLDAWMTVEIIASGTLLDACVNGQRTIIARRHALQGDRLFIFVQSGVVEFETPEAGKLLP